MKQSKFLSLNWRDFLRGLLMAVLTPVVAVIMDSLERGELNFNWHLVVITAFGGGIAYLSKQLLTKPDTAQKLSDDVIGDRPNDR